ncbi:MAG: hypothetical protein QOJ92_2679 [Frankiales bacterium]|nr:hypothetical protein [Frankiales bacterium]
MRSPFLLAASLSLTLLAAGCADSKPRAVQTPTPTPSETAPPIPAATALGQLASLGAAASYSATYVVTGSSPGTARIFRTRNGFRFELTTGKPGNRRKAVLIRTPSGSVSCTIAPTPMTCLLVALGNKPVPPLFDAGLQHVFSDYLVVLSKPSTAVRVSAAVAESPQDGACFRVAPTKAPLVVATGTYCIAPDGVVTRVIYPSGQVVLSSRGPAPRAANFVPPVKPIRLP